MEQTRIDSIVDLNDKYKVVYFDDGFLFKAKNWEINKLRLVQDMIVSKELYDTIFNEYGLRRCRFKAVDILSRSDKSEVELRKKLSDSFFASDVIDEIINELKLHKYVDDVRFATNYISYKSMNKSKAQLKMSLRSKGISPEVINQVLSREYNNDAEKILIRKNINKYADADNNIEEKFLNKIYASLGRKGIGFRTVEEILRDEYNVICKEVDFG